MIVALVAMLAFSAFEPAAAAPPPGKGPQPGADCPTGSAQIVLDPGHGGTDPGTSHPNGLIEKDLNLQIALIAADQLSGMNYTVALTRYGDTSLGNSERGEIANACGALVFVEIHLNGSSDPSVNYSQTFWGKRRKDEAFSQHMAGALAPLEIPSNGTWQFANGGLLQATMPSTLVEAVFLTNDGEAQMFAAGTRQYDVAGAIATGIDEWITSQP